MQKANIRNKRKNENLFCISSSLAELTFQYIYLELISGKYNFKKYENIFEYTYIIVIGAMRDRPIFWNDILEDEKDEPEMVRLLENILDNMKAKGSHISVEELQSFPEKPEDWAQDWKRPFATKNLILVYTLMIQIIKGELPAEMHNCDMMGDIDWD